MSTYRVQVTVGVDVQASSPEEATGIAISKLRDIISEDPMEPHPKPAWVTGIAKTDGPSSLEGFMVFETEEATL
jgi:hypothetical protein